jgi:hypothetical protein
VVTKVFFSALVAWLTCFTPIPATTFFWFCTVCNPVLLGFYRWVPLAEFSFLLLASWSLS